MSSPQRIRRVNETLREVLAELLQELKDPRVGFVTLTDVRASNDLGHAKVYYTVLPDDAETKDATREGLESAKPLLRRELGARVRLRHTPDLLFVEDPVPEQGRRIETLLAEAHEDAHGNT